jgi:hypothetical protein
MYTICFEHELSLNVEKGDADAIAFKRIAIVDSSRRLENAYLILFAFSKDLVNCVTTTLFCMDSHILDWEHTVVIIALCLYKSNRFILLKFNKDHRRGSITIKFS